MGVNCFGKSDLSRVEKLHLSPDVYKKLLELQRKGIDVNQLILEFLEKRELEITQEKEKLVSEMKEKGRKDSRYIPVKVRKIIREEYGEKCSIPHCSREAETIHHTQRFSLGRNHDPRFLAPLCKEHHQIAHSIDVKYQEYVSFSRVASSIDDSSAAAGIGDRRIKFMKNSEKQIMDSS